MNQPPSSGQSDSAFAALEPGFLVGNGRFTLVRLLGRGGMGMVWLARDEALREDVALKFLPPEIRFDAVALDDLRRETARSRKLTHPNIVRIHDLYRDEREAFISMEYIDGPNLGDRRVQQSERVFTWTFLEPLVKQLCEAARRPHRAPAMARARQRLVPQRARPRVAGRGRRRVGRGAPRSPEPSAQRTMKISTSVAADVRRLHLNEKQSEPPHVGCYEFQERAP